MWSQAFWVARLVGALLCAWLCAVAPAHAAPAWVGRGTNLPRGDWAFDPALGFAYGDFGTESPFGVGMNMEFAVGVLSELELGFRTGARFGANARWLHADEYGRLFDRQTFGTYASDFADPELRVRGRAIHGSVVELALEARAYLPVETGSRFGLMFGVPLVLHLGRMVRIDTGLYMPVLFRERTETMLSMPVDLWLQVTSRLWLGPMSGVRYYARSDETDISLGFGLGYQLTSAVDLKTMLLFPGINHNEGARHLGGGFGVQVRIE